MQANVIEWLHLLLRWAHILFAILWIGSSFFFMWLDQSLTAPSPPRERVKGELWMVHSGGFYQVEKRLIGPGQMPATLHWFKYEALFTWVTGILLLGVVYYSAGGVYLIDRQVADLSVPAAAGISLGVIIAGFAVYEGIWSSPIGRNAAVGALLTFGLLVGTAWGLAHVFSARAAYIHVGALMGTIMVANVWMRILPAQRQMIAATEQGKEPDHSLGERAKRRSVHNNYMTLPVIFIMISNHFPSTYGYRRPWLVLAVLMLAGAGVRHVINTRYRNAVPILGAVAAAVIAMFVLTLPASHGGRRASMVHKPAGGGSAQPIDPATVGTIHGVVTLDGAAPAQEPITVPADCAAQGGVMTESVVAKDGKLANVFVWIAEGADKWQAPAPSGEVVLDQRGCAYHPHVVGLRAGQPLVFVNSDPLLHNIHAESQANDEFNQGMQAADRVRRTFDEPEVMLHMKCDVHPWMSAWVGIVDHPWFAVTGPDGAFDLAGVPPGDYTVRAWHEKYGTLDRKVTVPAKGAGDAAFSFAAK